MISSEFQSYVIAITTVQNCSPIFPLGGHGTSIWLIVREVTMNARWWDGPLLLRDLTVSNLQGTLMQIWKCLYVFVFI